ncbi:MAG: ATP-binding cassette domain-containing protein, partial [Candidatus Rokubacteria bacterium]|nr:ATP-binding cassette domain-containing protein [Candidatus Rokubacteria bacterium]
DPYSSLNPRKRVRSIVGEPIVVNRALPRRAVTARVAGLLDQVGLPPKSADLYPHEFSGGQRQRIAIARALALNPSLVVLDEPVSALDVSIRAQIMNLLKDLQASLGLTYLLISHDLATMRYMATSVGVMYLGRLVETAVSADLFSHPCHPYTQALLSAALPSHPDIRREEVILPGEVPSPLHIPPGCRFHPRCPAAMPKCAEVDPEIKEVSPGHRVACHLY